MGHGSHDLAKHNAWATARLLAFLQHHDGSTLNATAPGKYGAIIATLRHLIDAEASYLVRLSGAWSAYPWPRAQAVGLDVLAERAAVLAATWEQLLAVDVGSERIGEARNDKGEVFAVPAGVFTPQALRHGTSTAPTSARSSGHWGTSRPTSRPGATPSPPGDRRSRRAGEVRGGLSRQEPLERSIRELFL